MARSRRSQLTLTAVNSACALVALTALAVAQPRDVECRKTETQAECHARLKCGPYEEVEECQKRLLKCRANETLEDCKKRVGSEPKQDARQRDDARGGERDADSRDRAADSRDRDRDADSRDRDRGADSRDRDRGADRSRRQRGRGQRGRGDRRRHGGGSKAFQANKTFGLGLELGEPAGLTGKYFLSENGAFDFGLGWIYRHYYYGDGLHLYGDYLHHPISLVSTDAFELPLYIGGGLRFWDFRYCFMGVCDYGGSALGVRIPIGIAFDFNNAPLDIFFQLVPVVDFIYGDYYDRFRDRSHVGIDGSLGIRFWFK